MKKAKWKWQGIRISTFNTLMIVFSGALYICLLVATVYTTQNYEQLVRVADEHIQLEETARTVLKASDYLTDQVRLYVQTQDETYARRYLEEVTTTKSREKALAIMQQYSIAPGKECDLTSAVSDSDKLMDRELYAIALVAAAKGHTETGEHALLSGIVLNATDAALPPQKKIDKARVIVYDTEYQTVKNEIHVHLDSFTRGILSTTESRLESGLENLNDAISTQRTLMAVLGILNVMTFFVITFLVVKPLHSFVRRVQRRSMLREEGAREFRYLARVYNDIYQRRDDLAASEARLRTKVEQDEITGLYNRPYFYKMVKERLRESDEDMYIVTVDISNFKIVNEHYGMRTGDRLLKDIGAQLRTLDKNGSMILARFMVDHYYICVPKSQFEEIEFPKAFKTFLEDMDIRVVYGVFLAEDRELPVHVMCDRALEAAHDKSYNYMDYIHFYDDTVHQQAALVQEIESEMEEALAQRQFHVVVQPKYDPITGNIVGGEALVRWQHPEKGMISPGVFISIFERDGFIASLDHYVWEETCRLQERMRQKGAVTVPISINVSRIHFYNRDLRSKLRELIEKYHLKPSDIELEITESICGEDAGNIFDMIRELQTDGFRIAMDDFGSGYSSLNMLKEMPLDIIKMDLRFLGGEENKSRVILKALIEMAQTMELDVVVEGVETLNQVEFLRQFKDCYLQGYYYSRPVGPDDFEALLQHTA